MSSAKVKMTLPELAAALDTVPPADLLGIKLLEQYNAQPGEWMLRSVPGDQIAQAARELTEYSARCSGLRRALNSLTPTPVEVSIPEFGL